MQPSRSEVRPVVLIGRELVFPDGYIRRMTWRERLLWRLGYLRRVKW